MFHQAVAMHISVAKEVKFSIVMRHNGNAQQKPNGKLLIVSQNTLFLSDFFCT